MPTDIEYLKNKTWLYRTKEYHVLHTLKADGKIIVSAVEGIIQFPEDKLKIELDNFLPVEDEKGLTAPGAQKKLLVVQEGSSIMSVLNEAIDKVKSDKNYIPQATSINKLVIAQIQLAKVHLEAIKAASK